MGSFKSFGAAIVGDIILVYMKSPLNCGLFIFFMFFKNGLRP